MSSMVWVFVVDGIVLPRRDRSIVPLQYIGWMCDGLVMDL